MILLTVPASLDLIQIIKDVGILPACLVGVGWFAYKMLTSFKSIVEDMSRTHKSEMDSVTQALNNNTLVIQRLHDRLKLEEEKQHGISQTDFKNPE